MEKFEMNGYRGSALPFFLTGLGTGIALALLLAPRSGAATRGLIGRKVNEGEDWIKDTAAATEDYVLSQAAGLRDRVNEVAEVIGRSTARTAGAKILERQEI
ncbi:MAG: YtxH domain-containing protein [Acidobacteriia bacterium]|nr:YtxH domain-containing protein [Terriglobia bacterium]